MNEQAKRTTFFGACPHDCPDTCAMVYEVDDGKLVNVKGNKEHPITRGTLVREAQGLPRSPPQSRPPDVPPAPRRPQGLRPERRQHVRAHHLGRGDLRDRPALARDHRRVRRPGDHAAKLSRQHGARAGHQLGRPVLQPARLDGQREDVLHVGLVDRLAADASARPAASTPKASCTASTSSSGPAIRSRPTCTTGRSCSRRRSAAPRSS